jgi:Zn finger protein HypA/HybF involved in hydrogenase expression
MKELPKYHRDGPFEDPVVRCTECQSIVYREELTKIGQCPKCGNRRVRNVTTLHDGEMKELKDKKVDPDFLALFGGVE